MKIEAIAIAVGGLGWAVDTVVLFPTHPYFAVLVCAPIALACLVFAWKL